MKAKEVRPGRAHTGAGTSGGDFRHVSNDSTYGAALQERILELLRVGEANALTLRDLTRLTEADGRRVRLAIRKARLSGVPVVSGDSGYWISGSPGETRRFTRQTRKSIFRNYL